MKTACWKTKNRGKVNATRNTHWLDAVFFQFARNRCFVYAEFLGVLRLVQSLLFQLDYLLQPFIRLIPNILPLPIMLPVLILYQLNFYWGNIRPHQVPIFLESNFKARTFARGCF